MKKQIGLTLIELMVTLAVFGVLIAVGIPKLQNMSAGNKLVSVVNKLSGDFAYARSEAATRQRPVDVVSANGNDWSQGWQLMDGATVIRQTTPMPAQTTLTSTVGTVTFNPDGSQTAGNLLFDACDPTLSTKASKGVGLNPVGRHQLVDGTICP